MKKQKKIISLLLCLVMVLSTLVTVSFAGAQNDGFVRLSLHKNNSYYNSTVPQGTKLIVTALDASGNEVSISGKNITYQSTRPWILDIDDDGNIVDGGFEGTTTVTATVDGLSASIIFIKGSGDGYNTAHLGEVDDFAQGGFLQDTLRVRRTWDSRATRVDPASEESSDEDKVLARVSGKKYLKLLADYANPGVLDLDVGALYGFDQSKLTEESWSKMGLRVVQNWFYDDGESAIHLRMRFIEDAKYLDDSLKQNLGTTQKDHLAWVADITADAGSEEYAQKYVKLVTENTENKIERSRGWHQATAILNDDATVDVFVDGKKLSSSKIADRIGGSVTQISVAGYTKGGYDDFVIAKNPNTTKPDSWNSPAERISLYKNTTFIKNIDTEQKIIVTGIDENGEDTILPEGDIIYTSSRPWVLDIDDKTGKFIDGGYEGTTTITATIGGMSASAIFIKGSGDGYNTVHRGEEDDPATASFLMDVLRVRRTWDSRATRVDPASNSTPASRVPGQKYLKLLADYENPGVTDLDSGALFGLDQSKLAESWSKLGLRVVQNWFYDDGEGAVHLRMRFIEDEKYLSDEFKQATGKNHLAWVADITADEGSDVYTQKYVKLVSDNTENKIERSRGWHQATAVLNDDATVDVFIDGKTLSSSKIADVIGSSVTHISVAGYVKGGYDDLVIAKNPNPTIPDGFELDRKISVAVDGIARIGQVLKAKVTVLDGYGKLSGETYQWQKYDGSKWNNIAGATDASYTVDASDKGSKLRVVVTPPRGEVAESSATDAVGDAIVPPSVKELSVSGEYELGGSLTVKYEYTDSEIGNGTDNSVIIFEVCEAPDGEFVPVQESSSKSFDIDHSVLGKYLRIRVIPKDDSGIAGKEVIIEATKIEGAIQYYVASDGDDSNPGTIDAPFRTIEKARDTIRTITPKPSANIIVNIRGGIYEIDKKILFTAEDSGTEDCRIIYQAYNNEDVSFVGGKELDASKIKPVTDEKLLDRLVDKNVKGKLMQLDLRAQGVEMSPVDGNGWYDMPVDAPNEIYMNGTRLTRARWPNDDESKMLISGAPFPGVDITKYNDAKLPVKMKYTDDENRTKNWQFKPNDILVGGAITTSWAASELRIDNFNADEKWFTTSDSFVYAIDPSIVGWGPLYKIYFANIFEEIDKPGESYIDRETGILYFYPVGKTTDGEMLVSMLQEEMIDINRLSYVSFKGINFKDSRSTILKMQNSNNVSIEDGEISGCSAQYAYSIQSCNDITVSGNHFYNLAGEAMRIKNCGDRLNCGEKPGNIVVENNNFHTYSLNPGGDGGRQAITTWDCAGITVRNNEFADFIQGAIRFFTTNDVLFEYNRIIHGSTFATDNGVVYWGADPTSYGIVIRYNHFEDIGSKFINEYLQLGVTGSIFVDDGGTGGEIYGNVFVNGGTGKPGLNHGEGSMSWKSNTGIFHNCYNNIIINEDDRATSWGQLTTWHDVDVTSLTYEEDGKTIAVDPKTSATTFFKMQGFYNLVRPSWTSASTFSESREKLLFSEEWKEHYKGTNWERATNFYSRENYEDALEMFKAGDRTGLLKWAAENLTQGYTNKVNNNLVVGISNYSQSDRSELRDNYIVEKLSEGAKLFEDFNGGNYTLTESGLKQVQTVAKEFKAIDFTKIGLYENGSGEIPGGRKPTIKVKDEIVNGVALAGNVITPAYEFVDEDGNAEGNSKIYWYYSSKANGKFEIIRDQATNDFAVTDNYAGKYLRYEVIPYDQYSLRGVAVTSEPIYIKKVFPDAEARIDEIDEIANSAVAGNEPGNYPADAIANLKSALETAKADIEKAKTESEANDVIKILERALVVFGNKVIKEKAPDSDDEPSGGNQGGTSSGGSGSAGGSGGGGGGGSSSGGGNKVTYDANAEANKKEETKPQDTEKPETSDEFVFEDVKGHWAEADIMAMNKAGIVSGVSETSFEPDREITRAEFATLVAKALKLENSESEFEDVSTSDWFAPFVGAAAKAGIVAGSDGKFRPNDTITRQEMAVIIVKAYEYLGKTTEKAELKFADNEEVADWATEFVAKAVGSGLISGMGDNRFAPSDNATRAQAASVIARIIK